MKLKALRQGEGFCCTEALVKRAGRMRVEVVLHDPDLLSFWVSGSQLFHKQCVFLFGPAVKDLRHSPPGLWFNRHQQCARAIFLVSIMLAHGLACFHLKTCHLLANQETWALIEANHWILLIIRQGIKRENLFHARDERGVHRAYAPLLLQMRLQFVFFRIERAPVCDRLSQ